MSMPEYDDSRGVTPVVDNILARLRAAETSPTAANLPNRSRPSPALAADIDCVDDEVVPQSDRWPLPGLAPMTRVRTSFGDVHAVALRKGDLIKTRSGEFKPIVWLNRIMLDERFLAEKPDANPVRIQAGALGPSTPMSDIMVSPRQVVCPTPKAALHERREAGELTQKPGVIRQRETGLSYTMFHLGEAAEVQCDGIFLLLEPPKA